MLWSRRKDKRMMPTLENNAKGAKSGKKCSAVEAMIKDAPFKHFKRHSEKSKSGATRQTGDSDHDCVV